jgi:hypothetical protein
LLSLCLFGADIGINSTVIRQKAQSMQSKLLLDKLILSDKKQKYSRADIAS